MKKGVTIIALILTFIIIYLIQINMFNWFNIAGVKPNLFIIFILFIGLYSGLKMGTIFGIIFGLIIDLSSGSVIRSISYSTRNDWIFAEDT